MQGNLDQASSARAPTDDSFIFEWKRVILDQKLFIKICQCTLLNLQVKYIRISFFFCINFIDVKIGDIPMNRFYLYAREVLIRQQEAENHLIVQNFGDRRYTYLRFKEVLIFASLLTYSDAAN